MRRIVLLNANTTAAMTDRMVSHATLRLDSGFWVEGRTAAFGAPYISDRPAAAAAAHAVAEMARGLAAEPPDAVIIACFGDPGLWAARALLPCPVIGMAEASLHAACQRGRKVAIVTGGHGWGPMLEEFVALCGLSSRVACIRTLALTGAQIAADPEAALASLSAEVQAGMAAGADVAVLGGAGLVGLAPRVAEAVSIPVLDSLDAALGQAVALTL
jgi:Asp/Glu/hydantoin racemase